MWGGAIRKIGVKSLISRNFGGEKPANGGFGEHWESAEKCFQNSRPGQGSDPCCLGFAFLIIWLLTFISLNAKVIMQFCMSSILAHLIPVPVHACKSFKAMYI